MEKTILLTGCAGFIGFNLAKKLLHNKKNKIIGIDNINDYYDINLKKNRLLELEKSKNFIFKKIDLINYHDLEKIVKKYKIKTIFNLAAQAGVSYSIKSPKTYMHSNILGFFNILELSRIHKIKKISGFILILTGILIITGKLQILGFYLIEYFPILQKLG